MAKSKAKNLPATTKKNLPVANIDDQMLIDAQGSTGFEDMGADDIAIPFVMILQALSPQVRGQARVKGASEGDFFNTVTNEILGGSIAVIPCAYEKAYVEWVPRNKGGGFVRKHSTPDILNQTERNEDNCDMLPNGNQIVATAYHYCLLVKEDETTEQVVISLTSTQLKKSRRWNSSMIALKMKYKGKILTPPMYSHIYEAATVEESNDFGQWVGWIFGNPEKITNSELYLTAKKFHEDIIKGAVRTAPPPDMTEHMGDSTDTVVEDKDDVF